MLELNKVLLIGRLTRDPELSYIPSGMALAKMGLAVNRRYKDKSGEWKDDTAFVDIEAWGKTAEFCSQYLKKGRSIFVEGRLKYDKWEASDCTKHSKLAVSADRVQFADAPPRSDQSGDSDEGQYDSPAQSRPSQAGPSQTPFPSPQRGPAAPDDSTADDLPF